MVLLFERFTIIYLLLFCSSFTNIMGRACVLDAMANAQTTMESRR